MLEKILVLLVVGIVALLFFGNRLPQVMGDMGRGIKAFKNGMNEGEGNDAPRSSKKLAATRSKKAVVKKTAKKSR